MYLIISYTECIEKLARSFEKYVGSKEVKTLTLSRELFDEELYYKATDYEAFYRQVSSKLEEYDPVRLRNLTVFFTLQLELPCGTVKGKEDALVGWNPLFSYNEEREMPHPRKVLLGWLLLSYPEVRWIFLSEGNEHSYHVIPLGKKKESGHSTGRYFETVQRIASNEFGGCIPLFDPCGVRNSLRALINEKAKNDGSNSHLPLRQQIASAIDEEESYAYFNAYAAYRFGYRVWCIDSWAKMDERFGNQDRGSSQEEKIDIVFEDLFLNFADRPSDFGDFKPARRFRGDKREKRLSNLAFRYCILPGLGKVKKRILVTVGHKRVSGGRGAWERNKKHLDNMKQYYRFVYKPTGGIFDFWRKAGLWKRGGDHPEPLEGFVWPLPKGESLFQEDTSHSSPGRLLAIAKNLIDRSEKILSDAQTVPHAIHAALLALEAKELLACRTPTTSLEALALQQRAEITAESMFYGIEYNLNVKDRFREIEREVKAISRWFRTRMRKRSELNSRLGIIEELARTFRDLNQFEEECKCLGEARKLRFSFWVRQKPWRWYLYPFIRYVELSLRSLSWFVAIVLFWIGFFGITYYLSAGGLKTLLNSFSASAMFFFTLNTASGWELIFKPDPIKWNFIRAFQGFISLFSIGLIVSHIYMIVSRR